MRNFFAPSSSSFSASSDAKRQTWETVRTSFSFSLSACNPFFFWIFFSFFFLLLKNDNSWCWQYYKQIDLMEYQQSCAFLRFFLSYFIGSTRLLSFLNQIRECISYVFNAVKCNISKQLVVDAYLNLIFTLFQRCSKIIHHGFVLTRCVRRWPVPIGSLKSAERRSSYNLTFLWGFLTAAMRSLSSKSWMWSESSWKSYELTLGTALFDILVSLLARWLNCFLLDQIGFADYRAPLVETRREEHAFLLDSITKNGCLRQHWLRIDVIFHQ